jgi:hypothetical protein
MAAANADGGGCKTIEGRRADGVPVNVAIGTISVAAQAVACAGVVDAGKLNGVGGKSSYQAILESIQNRAVRLFFSTDGKDWGLMYDSGLLVDISSEEEAKKAATEPHRLINVLGQVYYSSRDADMIASDCQGQRVNVIVRRRTQGLDVESITVPYSAKFVKIVCAGQRHCSCPDCPKNSTAATAQSRLPELRGRLRISINGMPTFDLVLSQGAFGPPFLTVSHPLT